ncbi:hypothetical protein V6N13_021657 [Hibiscus sabdariffa]|uniref:Uncharacterized protein n=1 Tax=Hibiscus sabdariffa TaxID=183260 RepID=A0ABR2BAE0_9ROSI
MPRSSRHKSSKHSSRDARDYSDSEKDSGLKEKEERSKEESSGRFPKEPGSGENRKLDSKDTSKDLWISENGDYAEEYSSSKRRKDKADGVSDRWNGGEDDAKVENKSRTSSESKGKRWEDAEGDDTKRSKSEGKHRESSRKEERDKEKKELHVPDRLQSPESESLPERRLRKKRDASDDGDKHLEDNGGILDRQLSVSIDTGKDARAKDERYKDKYQEDMNCEDKCQDDKLRDDRSASDHANSKFSEKHLRDVKDVKVRPKKSKVQDSDFERDRDHDRDCERYRERDRERYRDHYRERDCNRDHDHGRDYDSQWDRDHDRDRERDRHYIDRDKGRDHDRDERRSARYKDSKGRKRSPDDRDDGNDTKSRSTKLHYSVMEIKSSTSGRVEVDVDRGGSQSHPANFDASTGSNRRRASPSLISHGGTDEDRHLKQEDSNYRYQMIEQRSKAASSREVTSFAETPERGAKYRSMEKSNRVDEGHSVELPIERSSSSKASPMSMIERSPSTSFERRYTGRSGVKRGLDIEETGWSSASVGGREEDNRLSRDLPPEDPLLDGPSQADSLFYNKAGQGNSSLISQSPSLRAGTGSPSFMGSLEEDHRFNNSGRYKRSSDLNIRRGHANAWRGAPNWLAPVPNGFIPFQPGPPHGGFQAMMPQFHSPSLFGVRPSMEINHSGIPYHIPDAERFNNHLRPMAWQNTMDGSGPAPFHGWDGHNVSFRDEAHMFGPSEWDQNRHPVNGQGWDTSSDVWKGQNGDVYLPTASQKEDHPLQAPLDDVYDGSEHQKPQYENGNNGVQVKDLEIRSDVLLPVMESSKFSSEISHKTPDSSKISREDDDACCCQVYLCKLDISAELAGCDLYDQCMSLMNVEQNKDLSKDVTMLVNLKTGGRPVQNTSIAVLSPSLIPATNASVFQRAMDLYKKQRLQMGAIPNVNGGILAFTSVTKEKGKEEQSSDHVVDLTDEPVLISDAEVMDSARLDSDQQKSEAVPTAAYREKMEWLVSTQSRESPDSLSPETSERPNTGFGCMNTEVPKPVLNGNKAEESETDEMNSGDVGGDSLQSLDNEAETAVGEENSKDILNKTEGNSCSISGSLNDSVSNECESVILSQIHDDSPESTH